MNKIIAIAAAGVIAVGTSLVAVAPSQAHMGGPGPFPFFAGAAGFIAGAAIAGAAANSYRGPYWQGGYYGGPGWDQHVAACAATYKTYSPRDDSYTTVNAYGQYIRVPCQL